MKVLAKCPKCGGVLELSEDDVDKRKRCRHCLRRFKVPDLLSLDKAVKVVETADAPVFVDQDGHTYA